MCAYHSNVISVPAHNLFHVIRIGDFPPVVLNLDDACQHHAHHPEFVGFWDDKSMPAIWLPIAANFEIIDPMQVPSAELEEPWPPRRRRIK